MNKRQIDEARQGLVGIIPVSTAWGEAASKGVDAIDALRARVSELDTIRVDEDGCCVACGRTVEPCEACDESALLRQERDEARAHLEQVTAERDALLVFGRAGARKLGVGAPAPEGE